MDLFTRKDLKDLIAERRGPCISIYQPTHESGGKSEENRIGVKNRIGKAEELLERTDFNPREIERLMAPAKELLEDSYFWSHQSGGLAMFISKKRFWYVRLALKFQPLTVLTDRFHIKPLLPLFTADGKFYVLALSQNSVRLMEGTHLTVNQVHLADVPANIDAALWHDDPERTLQMHSGNKGGKAAVFHGHGVGSDEGQKKDDLLRYFRMIDKGLHEILAGENAPLIVAAVDYLHPIYREANTYPYLIEEGVDGNPDHMKPEDLHIAAWEIVEPRFRRGLKQAAERFRELLHTEHAVDDVKAAVIAGYDGMIDTLFVPVGVQRWGFFRPRKREIEFHESRNPTSEDLLDLTALETLLHSGKVYAVKPEGMPVDSEIAAILRS